VSPEARRTSAPQGLLSRGRGLQQLLPPAESSPPALSEEQASYLKNLSALDAGAIELIEA